MRHIYALDPGYEQSALVLLTDDGTPRPRMNYAVQLPNEAILEVLENTADVFVDAATEPQSTLVIESIESYGMPVGREVFETVFWSGRFAQAWGFDVARVPRRTVKLTLCGSPKANDATIRQALIDRYGPTKAQAIGLKASPGPLYGLKADLWQALAVGVTWLETSSAAQKGAGATQGADHSQGRLEGRS